MVQWHALAHGQAWDFDGAFERVWTRLVVLLSGDPLEGRLTLGDESPSLTMHVKACPRRMTSGTYYRGHDESRPRASLILVMSGPGPAPSYNERSSSTPTRRRHWPPGAWT